MWNYDLFSSLGKIFQPKTPVAALRAYEEGLNPLEMFIFKSGSAKPLNEEPYDREALERFLSRGDLDLEANALLISIFDRMIYLDDQELALFAAESINIIENRYNHRIEQIKKNGDGTILNQKDLLTLGRLFYELAVINKSREAIKKFYFRESYHYFTQVREKSELEFTDLEIIVRILLELKLYENALTLFEKESRILDARHMYLKLEILFRMGKYAEVSSLCLRLMDDPEGLTEGQRIQIAHWIGNNE